MSDIPDIVVVVATLAAAPAVGSFVGVLADRLPRGEPVGADRSRCRACGRTLGPAELIPLLSYLALRGRCAGCGAVIPRWLPGVELAALGLAAWAAAVMPTALLWPTAALGWLLLALAVVDARAFVLPYRLTVPLAAGGLAFHGWRSEALPIDGLIGLAAGWGLFAAVILAYRAWRGRDGMGWGDAALLGAGGAWVGWQGLTGVVLIAAFSGLAAALALGHRRADARSPFGPALAWGVWLVWLYGPPSLTFDVWGANLWGAQ